MVKCLTFCYLLFVSSWLVAHKFTPCVGSFTLGIDNRKKVSVASTVSPRHRPWLSLLTRRVLLFPDELVQEYALQGSESEEIEHRRAGTWVPRATGIGSRIGAFLTVI